jgi:hypothetical protein
MLLLIWYEKINFVEKIFFFSWIKFYINDTTAEKIELCVFYSLKVSWMEINYKIMCVFYFLCTESYDVMIIKMDFYLLFMFNNNGCNLAFKTAFWNLSLYRKFLGMDSVLDSSKFWMKKMFFLFLKGTVHRESWLANPRHIFLIQKCDLVFYIINKLYVNFKLW